MTFPGGTVWSKAKMAGPDDCWVWSGLRSRAGYGRVHIPRVGKKLAHRVAFCVANGVELRGIEGLFVCHSCDNPSCVNPAHLWLGTAADNVSDMVAKGRSKKVVLKTMCIRGHAEWVSVGGKRRCAACRRLEGEQRKSKRRSDPAFREKLREQDRSRYWENPDKYRERAVAGHRARFARDPEQVRQRLRDYRASRRGVS